MKLGFMMCSDTQKIVLKNLQSDIDRLSADQRVHVEHLLRSWRTEGMYWEAATKRVRQAIRRTLRDRP